MDLSTVSVSMVVNLLVLMLIGMGPKIALVPFLEKTKHLEAHQQREVGVKMVKTAFITAIVLFACGALLMRLLHISGGAISIAGGIILLILALGMFAGPGKKKEEGAEDEPTDIHSMAVYPLAIPYLLNPVGVAVLIIASGEVGSIWAVLVVLAVIVVIAGFDYLIFSNIDKLSKRLKPTTLVISEVVFGILLIALAVEMVIAGLGRFGIIEAVHH